MTFAVERRSGTAAALHGRPFHGTVERRVVVLEPAGSALVLGSAQPDTDVDATAAAARGVEVCRRRSGGGAVLLVPVETAWIDVEIGRDDPLWDDDVGRSFHWLGRAWAAALETLAIDADVHVGALVTSRWSRRVCFAGLGPGEVTTDGRKLVGISQRRTRTGARFQCVVHRRWDPGPLLELLALDPLERVDARLELDGVATGIDVALDVLVDALVHDLRSERWYLRGRSP